MARALDKKSVSSAEDDYQFPPIDLLDAPPPAGRAIDRSVMEENAATLEQKLNDLGVRGEVVAIHPGAGNNNVRAGIGKRHSIEEDSQYSRRPGHGFEVWFHPYSGANTRQRHRGHRGAQSGP